MLLEQPTAEQHTSQRARHLKQHKSLRYRTGLYKDLRTRLLKKVAPFQDARQYDSSLS